MSSGKDANWGAVVDQLPDFIHLLVVDCNAAIGPVQSGIGKGHILGAIWQAVDHNAATRAQPPVFGHLAICFARVGNMNGLVKVAAGVPPVKSVLALGGSLVALV